MAENLIDQYLITRGLWKPRSGIKSGEANDILNDPDKLAKVAGLFDTYGDALAWILEEQAKVMALELVRDADPREVIVIRQAMVEVANIWDEAQKYSIQYKKEKEDKEASGEAAQNIEDNGQESEPPPVAVGEL